MVPEANEALRARDMPFLILLSTAALLAGGVAAAAMWSQTGDATWLRSFFDYGGALFLVGCSLAGCWAAFRCWSYFSRGDLLRPAWLLIALSALFQFSGGVITHILGSESLVNPARLLPSAAAQSFIGTAAEYGRLFSPIYMLLLAFGLFSVLKVCRRNGILGRLRAIDVVLVGIVAVYTIDFFRSVVFAPGLGHGESGVQKILSWTSDPLLCVLLLQAILIRRSVANLGWGLIARCWMSFTAAIFLTSVGDIGLWASANGYLPKILEIASWYVWFLASAAYALGPSYQLQAMVHASSGHTKEVRGSAEPVATAV